MMKKEKIFVLASIATLSGALVVGCGSSGSSSEKKTVQICVISKGYGDQFAYDLADSYNQKQNKFTVKVVRSTPDTAYTLAALNSGPSNNDIDIFFSLTNDVCSTIAQKKTYGSYSGTGWADLSDIYDSSLEGYEESGEGVTIKSTMDPFFLKNYTYSDGKQYAIPWTSGTCGLLYNKTLWDKTNKNLESAGKKALSLPKTTSQMFSLFETIKGSDVQTASSKAYAFNYSGTDPYLHYLFGTWFGQYDGKEKAYASLEGKDEKGVYTADIYNTEGRLEAYEGVRNTILKTNGYTDSKDISKPYSQAQLDFLKGKAIFSCNGDWLEQEASSQFNPGDADVAFIRTPVLSSIVNNEAIASDFTGTDEEKETKLETVIDYIDTHYLEGTETPDETAASSLSITLSTLSFLKDARSFQFVEPVFNVTVTGYSNEVSESKEFLKYMLSKEGQEIFMSSTYGVGAPLNVSMEQFDYYKEATVMCKSKYALLHNATLFGNANAYPMEYLSSITVTRDSMSSGFGTDSPMTAAAYQKREYDYYKTMWSSLMSLAGVSND